jgi:hypothetical protein
LRVRTTQSLSHTHTEALLCCFASAFVPISDENRDGGRAFPNSLESQLRFAGSGPHRPPRWRTRGRRSDLSLPVQEKSDSGNMSGQPTAPGLGDQRPRLQPDRAIPTLPPSRHTCRGVLAQPSNNSKKSGWGQTDSPPLRIFPLYSIECNVQAPFTKAKSA